MPPVISTSGGAHGACRGFLRRYHTDRQTGLGHGPEEASPRSHGRNRQRLGGLGKPLVHPRTAAPSVLTAVDRARGEAAINGDAGMDSNDNG
jgi:hypothetical protein